MRVNSDRAYPASKDKTGSNDPSDVCLPKWLGCSNATISVVTSGQTETLRIETLNDLHEEGNALYNNNGCPYIYPKLKPSRPGVYQLHRSVKENKATDEPNIRTATRDTAEGKVKL